MCVTAVVVLWCLDLFVNFAVVALPAVDIGLPLYIF